MELIRRYIVLAFVLVCGVYSVSAQNCIYPAGSQIYSQNINCSLESELCIDIPFAERNDFDVYLDGNLYTDPYRPCNYDTLFFYTTNRLVNHITAFPVNDMFVDSVRINGQVHSFGFATIEDLADSLSLKDNTATWMYDPIQQRLLEGNTNSTYGAFYFRDILNTTTFQGDFQDLYTPNGLFIDITNGLHEVVLHDLISGCRDTLEAESFCLNNDVIRDTLFVNEIDTICFELTDLRGAVTDIINICPGESGTEAMIEVIPGTGCIEVTALDVGLDSACIVIIDDEDLRDTIYYTIQVIESMDTTDFYTRRDSFDILIDEPITFNPLANDRLPQPIDTVYISGDPTFGTAVVNTNGTITYQPNTGYESNGIPDTIEYTVCISSICRTDFILIDVAPPAIMVMDGFSPNEDGINDTFVISNLTEFPNNTLCVFNRWGNQVYQVENYQNDWDGKWDGNTILPDGTYFYVLDVEVDAEMEQHSGYVELKR